MINPTTSKTGTSVWQKTPYTKSKDKKKILATKDQYLDYIKNFYRSKRKCATIQWKKYSKGIKYL